MKTNASKNKESTGKKVTKNNRSSKRKITISKSKGKVYIPRSKIVLLCLGIIGFCMLLLLITTMVENSTKTEITDALDLETVIEIQNNSNDSVPVESKPVEKTEKDNSTQKENPAENKETKKEVQTTPVEKTVTTEKKEDKIQPKQEEPKPSVTTETVPVPVTTKTEPVLVTKKTDTVNTTPSQNNKVVDFGFPKAVNNAQLVFLFDDGGQNLSHLDKFLNLPFPITVAVLPKLAHSKESAEKIRKSGNELMLHQPMQAINLNVNPGPGAITPDMTEEQIIWTITQNVNEIGPISGINNHEGSAITADAEKMETVLKSCNKYGIFFLDSRTNKDTKVPYVCKELGYTYFERNGNFLDNKKTRENALSELRKNIDIANKTGVVIMIGHIWSADFLPQLLTDVYPELKAKGYKITTVSKCNGRK